MLHSASHIRLRANFVRYIFDRFSQEQAAEIVGISAAAFPVAAWAAVEQSCAHQLSR